MSKTQHLDGGQESARDMDTSDSPQSVLQEGTDYYFENGLMVFTAAFLEKRGFCCEQGCRNCPYSYVEDQRGSFDER